MEKSAVPGFRSAVADFETGTTAELNFLAFGRGGVKIAGFYSPAKTV